MTILFRPSNNQIIAIKRAFTVSINRVHSKTETAINNFIKFSKGSVTDQEKNLLNTVNPKENHL